MKRINDVKHPEGLNTHTHTHTHMYYQEGRLQDVVSFSKGGVNL